MKKFQQKQLQMKHLGNMKAFPAQFNRFSKNVMGDNIISLRVDEMFSTDILELLARPIGTEFMVHLEEIDINMPAKAPAEKDLKEKLWSRMHILINDYAELLGEPRTDIKEELKTQLKKMKLIKESTKELGVKGLTEACKWLEAKIENHGK